MRDHADELQRLGVRIVGISPDPPQRQAEFDRRNELGFSLLSDADATVAAAWGVRRESLLGALLPIVRSVFLIDAAGIVEHAWYGISPTGTVPAVLDALG